MKRLLALATLLAASCLMSESVMAAAAEVMPPIGKITKIVVVTRGRQSPITKEISEPADVARIAAFVDANRTGWTTPWTGIPVPSLDVRLYDEKEFKGSFGAGKSFFETQRLGAFYSKNASSKELVQFAHLLGIDTSALH